MDMMNEMKEHFDVDYAFIAHLNGECLDWAGMDNDALQGALQAQGEPWHGLVKERCPHLFAAAPVFISALQLKQMQAVIAAVKKLNHPSLANVSPQRSSPPARS